MLSARLCGQRSRLAPSRPSHRTERCHILFPLDPSSAGWSPLPAHDFGNTPDWYRLQQLCAPQGPASTTCRLGSIACIIISPSVKLPSSPPAAHTLAPRTRRYLSGNQITGFTSNAWYPWTGSLQILDVSANSLSSFEPFSLIGGSSNLQALCVSPPIDAQQRRPAWRKLRCSVWLVRAASSNRGAHAHTHSYVLSLLSPAISTTIS